MELHDGRLLTMSESVDPGTGPSPMVKEIILTDMVEATKLELLNGKALTLNNLVEVYKARTSEYGILDTRTDAAIRMDLRRVVRKRLCEKIEGVELQNAFGSKESQRLVTNNIKAFAQKYAEENSSLSNDAEVNILNQASKILRRKALNYLKEKETKLEDFKSNSTIS